jgi:hypothetical protein
LPQHLLIVVPNVDILSIYIEGFKPISNIHVVFLLIKPLRIYYFYGFLTCINIIQDEELSIREFQSTHQVTIGVGADVVKILHQIYIILEYIKG